MSQGPVLGIDLGTTNSVVAVSDGGQTRILTDLDGRRMVPSVVSFHPNGETLVGYDARERRLVDAENTVYAVKRLIGRPFDSPEVTRARERFGFNIVKNKHGGSVVEVRRGKYALAEISAMVLRQLRRIAEADLGVPCERAVVTVPANFNELQRSATKAAGKVGGLDVLRILNEPTAAALAYGLGKGRREKVAVYDLGGGTFDFTILDLDDDVFEVLATAGDTFLGGEDLDDAVGEAMADHFLEQHSWDPRSDRQAFERLKAAGEWAKCQLSKEAEIELTIEALSHGTGGKALDLDYTLTRKGLEEIARPWLERSFVVCDAAMQTAGLKAADIGSVALVGGSTRMPLVHQMVEAYFGKKPRTDVDPDMVVAQGAAIHGFAIGGQPRASAPAKKVKPTAALGRVMLKKVTRAQLDERRTKRKRATLGGAPPKGPAFAPMERPASQPPPARPQRLSAPPPPMPDLPPQPAVVSSPMIEIRSPKSTLDGDLDALAPSADLAPASALDDLAPPSFAPDPFADVDPFAVPDPGSQVARNPILPMPEALPPPTRRDVPSREPTTPFFIEDQPNKKAPPKRPAGVRPPAPPPGAGPPPIPPALPPPPPPRLPAPPGRPIRPPVAAAKEPAAPLKQPELAQTVLPMPETAPPILMDVTPHSLGLETAGGYCRRLILKNAPLPTEQTRTFTTAKDGQTEVAVRICQGESETFADNDVLGEVVLDELPGKTRGELQIEVAFILDANGTLHVEAKDAESGRVQKTRVALRGGLSDAEIAGMRLRLEAEDL